MPKQLPAPTPPTCGARTRAGTPCRNPAGHRTDHLGQGRCSLHGGATPIKHGRYSSIKRERIGELIEQFEKDPDPRDIRPELAALRALFVDYIERYEEWREAFLLWHAAFAGRKSENPVLASAAQLVLNEAAPRKVMDLIAAGDLLDKVSKIVERMDKRDAAMAVSRKDLLRIVTEMARSVNNRVEDATVREQIQDDWARIALA